MNFSGGGANSFLEQIDAGSFADGIVNVIDVGAIRAHAPDRWARRVEQVEDYVNKAFRKRARASDILFRLSDTQFIAIQPGATRAAAMACCGHVARETFGYFLGAEVRPTIRLLAASSYGPDGLAAAEIAPETVDAAMAGAGLASDDAPGEQRGDAWRSFSRAHGRSARLVVQVNPLIEATLCLQPIWHSGHGAIASFLVDPVILGEVDGSIAPMRLAELPPLAAGALAATMIDFAAETLQKAEAEGRRFALHLPVSLEALTPSRERLMLRNHFTALLGPRAQLVVIELADCLPGMPQSRMMELVSGVRPYCRAVIARVDGDAPAISSWRQAGLAGVALVFDGRNVDTAQADMQRIRRLADVAVAPRSFVVAHGLAKRETVLAAWASGYTHVSGQIITDMARDETRPVRLTAAQIFA